VALSEKAGANMTNTLDGLLRSGLSELEQIYAEARMVEVPTGRYRGHHLTWTATGRRSAWRPLLTVGFRWTPFGVDFDRRLWFFWRASLAAGRFDPSPGRSRWRETDVVRLRYHPSALPGFVKGVLYDEVKPLSPALCLGIGGVNAPRGRGEMFFFALERLAH
jgi:hypothetical protein